MAMVAHLHHLFNPDTCQSSIHTLRWKERPLQCPRRQSHNVGPWDCLPLSTPIGHIATPFVRPVHDASGSQEPHTLG
jgi:hypothetical protein